MKGGIRVYWLLNLYVFVFDNGFWECHVFRNSNPQDPEHMDSYLNVSERDPFKHNSNSRVSY